LYTTYTDYILRYTKADTRRFRNFKLLCGDNCDWR